jgi:D-glycero-D-manno-heptose 1,7-bisphosphate phosphatase
MTRWAVFFDRDGVLTDAPVVDGQALAPMRATDLAILPGAREAVAIVHALGSRALLVTNQPDIARGTLDPAELELMHQRLTRELGLDDIRVCPHDGDHPCRKPAPGMLLDLAATHDVDLSGSYMIGDRWVDIAAGAAAGATTILVEHPYSWSSTSAGAPPAELAPDHRVPDVLAAARLIEGFRMQPFPRRSP